MNFTIDVFWNDPLKFVNDQSSVCGRHPGKVGVSATITCTSGVRGRYVRLTLFSYNPLTLCEVHVHGVAVSKPGIQMW